MEGTASRIYRGKFSELHDVEKIRYYTLGNCHFSQDGRFCVSNDIHTIGVYDVLQKELISSSFKQDLGTTLMFTDGKHVALLNTFRKSLVEVWDYKLESLLVETR
jgi:hypothetical protein